MTIGRNNVIVILEINRPMVENKEKVRNEKMAYADLFSNFKTQFLAADVSDVQEHLAYQFNVTGEDGGIFYVEVKNGQLSIEPYEYFDRDVIFMADGDTFLKIASGELDAVEAFTVGKLKMEGNVEKALKLQELINSKRR